MRFFLKNEVGSRGEKLGCQYLKKKGYRILETNYCNASGKRLGEIDIVAEKAGQIVFVEVKTRSAGSEGAPLPEASIGRDKLRRLERIAQCYMRERKREASPYRFDALSIAYGSDASLLEIRHLESIFL